MSCPKKICLQRPEINHGPTIDHASIDNLNDDCLGKVFQFLPLGDKFRIRAVCKRWKELSGLAWENTKWLTFARLGPENSNAKPTDLQELPPRARTTEGLKRVLKKCGVYLKRVRFMVEVHGSILPVIANYCQNLVFLQITCDYEHWRCSIFFPQLKHLIVKGSVSADQTIPEELFQAMPHESLLELDLTVNFDDPFRAMPHAALTAFDNFTKLSSISLFGFVLAGTAMEAIARISTLKSLVLSMCSLRDPLPSFASLTNLEELFFLENRRITDGLLIEIAEACRELKSLAFSSNCVTDRGLSSLKILTKLGKLTIIGVSGITDAPLSTMHNLKSLACNSCPGVRDDGIITLIRYAHNLKLLSLIGTGVTQRVLNEANEIMKQRTNSIKLYMFIDDSLVRGWDVNERSSLLQIIS